MAERARNILNRNPARNKFTENWLWLRKRFRSIFHALLAAPYRPSAPQSGFLNVDYLGNGKVKRPRLLSSWSKIAALQPATRQRARAYGSSSKALARVLRISRARKRSSLNASTQRIEHAPIACRTRPFTILWRPPMRLLARASKCAPSPSSDPGAKRAALYPQGRSYRRRISQGRGRNIYAATSRRAARHRRSAWRLAG
jgi:hypothetical protein